MVREPVAQEVKRVLFVRKILDLNKFSYIISEMFRQSLHQEVSINSK